jgi:hypothetical protein
MISTHGDEEEGFYNLDSFSSGDSADVFSPSLESLPETSTFTPQQQQRLKLSSSPLSERNKYTLSDRKASDQTRTSPIKSPIFPQEAAVSRRKLISIYDYSLEPDDHSWWTRCSMGVLSVASIVSFFTAMAMIFTSPVHYAIMLVLKCTVGHVCCPVNIIRPIRNVLLTPARWGRIALCGVGHICCWSPHSVWPTNESTSKD